MMSQCSSANGALCASAGPSAVHMTLQMGAHMSFLMNSTRLVTLFFTSISSCLTSTGPMSLKTLASSSSNSSSCQAGVSVNQIQRYGKPGIVMSRRLSWCGKVPVNSSSHLEDHLILKNLGASRGYLPLNLPNLFLDCAVCVQLIFQWIPAIAARHGEPPIRACVSHEHKVSYCTQRRHARQRAAHLERPLRLGNRGRAVGTGCCVYRSRTPGAYVK